MKKLLLAGALLLGAATPPANAVDDGGTPPAPPPAGVFPYPHTIATLKNGLQVVMVPRRGSGLLAYYTLVRVGSRNEVEPGRSGYAHFFEHMMFRGTEKYPQDKYEDVIKRYGANNNAYTDDDLTVYTIFGRAEGLEKFVEIEADRFQNLKYSRAAYETEAKAILGEYNKSRSDPDEKMYEELCNAAFTRHTYKHTTIGFEADIRSMPQGYDYSLGFFRKYYSPDNTTVILVGDFAPERARALIESAYGGWRGRAVEPKTAREPPQRAERKVELPWDRPAQPKMMMGWHTPEATPRTARERAVASLLQELVFGSTSPLYQDLVLDKQISDELDAWSPDRREPHLFVVTASARDPARLPEILAAIDAELSRVAAHGVDEKRLAAVKSRERYAFLSSLERDSAVADTLANILGITGNLQWLDQQFTALDAVTNDDIKAFVARYLVPANRTLVTLRVPGEGE
ncbi:MAG: pitrilysin family protein [Myxococcota bacterium]